MKNLIPDPRHKKILFYLVMTIIGFTAILDISNHQYELALWKLLTIFWMRLFLFASATVDKALEGWGEAITNWQKLLEVHVHFRNLMGEVVVPKTKEETKKLSN